MRADADVETSAAAMVLENPRGTDALPIAVTLQARMKGAPREVASAELGLVARSVSRNIGSAVLTFEREDGSIFDPEGLRTPEFSLTVDAASVAVAAEYLLEPGIHRITLRSETFQDQSVSVGIRRGEATSVTIPLLPALATVTYSAPRGSAVWLDGRRLDGETGVFTAVPGEHTIVVAVGDYTVTRRFAVQEGREYNISVTMDVAVEETK